VESEGPSSDESDPGVHRFEASVREIYFNLIVWT